MRNSVPRWTFVVPSKSLIDVRGATDIVARRIALTSEDVNEALADAFHDEGDGISRASKNAVSFREGVSRRDTTYAVAPAGERSRAGGNCSPTSLFAFAASPLRRESYVETAFA